MASTAVALMLPGSAVSAVNAVLGIMLYLLVPWTAVNLLDYFLLHKGNYSIEDLFDPGGTYGMWNARGLLSYVAGLLASVPFMLVSPIFTGPLVARLDGVDVAWFVGLFVSGACYLSTWWLGKRADATR